jgi:mercuric ion transport protein
MNTENKIMGAGVFSALTASLCCITPILSVFAGTSGLVSSFSWLGTYRPYFIGLSILILGLAWYRQIRAKSQLDCACEPEEKPKFIQSKLFLGLVTVFVGLTLTFPMYAHIFYPKPEQSSLVLDESVLGTVEFAVQGMTCSGCADHISLELNKVQGPVSSSISYPEGTAKITFDRTKTSPEELQKLINSLGYTATLPKEN